MSITHLTNHNIISAARGVVCFLPHPQNHILSTSTPWLTSLTITPPLGTVTATTMFSSTSSSPGSSPGNDNGSSVTSELISSLFPKSVCNCAICCSNWHDYVILYSVSSRVPIHDDLIQANELATVSSPILLSTSSSQADITMSCVPHHHPQLLFSVILSHWLYLWLASSTKCPTNSCCPKWRSYCFHSEGQQRARGDAHCSHIIALPSPLSSLSFTGTLVDQIYEWYGFIGSYGDYKSSHSWSYAWKFWRSQEPCQPGSSNSNLTLLGAALRFANGPAWQPCIALGPYSRSQPYIPVDYAACWLR